MKTKVHKPLIHKIKKSIFLAMLLFVSACTSQAGSIKIKIDAVNVYHLPNETTCELVKDYVKDHPKLKLFYENEPDEFTCTTWRKTLYSSLGNVDSGFSITEMDGNVFEADFRFYHSNAFTYVKDGITKDATVSIGHYLSMVNHEVQSKFNDITLVAGGQIFQIQYDEDSNSFQNRTFDKWKQEVRFTDDLQAKVIDFYTTTKNTKLTNEEAKNVVDALGQFILETGDKTSSDSTSMKTINDITFDRIYPLMNSVWYTGVPTYHAIKDYYVVEKDGKFGLVNNNGLLIMDIIQDNMFYILDKLELVGQTEEIGEIPFTMFYFGGGRGIGRHELFIDKKLNQVMAMTNGHDGPGVYGPYDRIASQFSDYPALPYRTTEECRDVDEFVCESINTSKQYGLMKPSGELITETIFDNVHLTKGPLIPVQRDNLWGYVDVEGNQVIDFLYEGIFPWSDTVKPYPVTGSYVVVKNTVGKFGVLDLQGKELVPFNYDWISPYFMEQVILKKGDAWTANKMK